MQLVEQRRALDRIAEGRVKNQLPSYMQKLLAGTTAPIVFGADFTASPVPDAAPDARRSAGC